MEPRSRGDTANIKGLGHGFGVNATLNSIPMNKIQELLGDADLKTTAIYADEAGAEEDRIAERIWGGHG